MNPAEHNRDATMKGKISALILGFGLGMSLVGVFVTGLAFTVWPSSLHIGEMLTFIGFFSALVGLTGLFFEDFDN